MPSPAGQQVTLSASELTRLSKVTEQVALATRTHASTLQARLLGDLMPRFQGEMSRAFVQVQDTVQTNLRAVIADMDAMGQQVNTTGMTHSHNDAAQAAAHRKLIGGIPAAINHGNPGRLT